jgi:hypothetical protein
MEEFTANIEYMLNEKLSLYRQMNDLLRQEREYIVNIDVDALWKTSHEKGALSDQIHELRQSILNDFETHLGITEMTETAFSLAHLIRILPIEPELKKRFRQIKLAIDQEKDQLAQSAKDNKIYVQEYLMVIDDIMAVVADNSKESQYSKTGHMPNAKASNSLIHAEV